MGVRNKLIFTKNGAVAGWVWIALWSIMGICLFSAGGVSEAVSIRLGRFQNALGIVLAGVIATYGVSRIGSKIAGVIKNGRGNKELAE